MELARRFFPETKWLILVSSGRGSGARTATWWEDPKKIFESLESLQKDYPDDKKIRYSHLELPFEDDFANLTRYFRALIRHVASEGYIAGCDVTAGLFEYQLALITAAQIESQSIANLYYFNKQNNTLKFLPRSFTITTKEQKIVEIFQKYIDSHSASDVPYVNLSKLQELCEKAKLEIDTSNLSRIVNNLIKKGTLEEKKEGRNKFLTISEQGTIFGSLTKIQEDIKAELNTPSK